MLRFKNRTFNWSIKQEYDNNEDLNFFRPLGQYIKKVPSTQQK